MSIAGRDFNPYGLTAAQLASPPFVGTQSASVKENVRGALNHPAFLRTQGSGGGRTAVTAQGSP